MASRGIERDATSRSASRASGVVGRHWRGALPLGPSFWIVGVAAGQVGVALLLVAAARVAALVDDLRVGAVLALVAIVVAFAISVWSLVGVWRAAGGARRRRWGVAARLLVALATLRLAVVATSEDFVEQARELVAFSVGRDRLPVIATRVASDGRSMLVSGRFGLGSARAFERALDAAPSVRTIELDSDGGRVLEARRVARDVARRGLDTHVESLCASACTIVFVAGRDRSATPNARLGFHRASFTGRDGPSSDDPLVDAYRARAIDRGFVAKVAATRPDDLWFPGIEELVASGVVGRVSLGGETSRVADALDGDAVPAFLERDPTWRAVEARFPGTRRRALDAMRRARDDGRSSTDVIAASRRVVAALLPAAMRDAPDAVLDAYLSLTNAELDAANALGPQACADFVSGRLDIAAVMPATVREQDAAFVLALFEAPARTDGGAGPAVVERARRRAFEGFASDDIDAIARLGQLDPARRCVLSTKLHRAIAGLDTADRHAMLQGLFQR